MAVSLLKKRTDLDMTEGGIFKNLITFAIPLILGNLFQQLYNMMDTYVIGQTHDSSAYAAVGSVGPIINMFIGFFLGLSAGAGVVISQYYGAKNRENVERAVHTTLSVTAVLCVVFTAAGVLLSPFLVKLMLGGEVGTPLFRAAKSYLTIYFSGITGLLIYNMGSGILRAVGDSAKPFLFLVVSAVTNTVLDFLFVFGFGMGVEGVAYATIIAQAISAALVILTLFKTSSWVKISLRKFVIDFAILKKVLIVGLPAALQMMLTAFSNVFVQSYIGGVEGYGAGVDSKSIYLSAWTTYSKVDAVMFMPLQSLNVAVTTFVGQNIGAGKIKRAKEGAVFGYVTATCIVALLMMPIIIYAPNIAAVFNSDAEVVMNATLLLRNISPFYLFTCVNQIFSGAIRGTGRSTAPMVMMLTSFVGIRQIYLYIMSHYISNTFMPIAISYPIGWICCATMTLIFFLKCDFSKKKLT